MKKLYQATSLQFVITMFAILAIGFFISSGIVNVDNDPGGGQVLPTRPRDLDLMMTAPKTIANESVMDENFAFDIEPGGGGAILFPIRLFQRNDEIKYASLHGEVENLHVSLADEPSLGTETPPIGISDFYGNSDSVLIDPGANGGRPTVRPRVDDPEEYTVMPNNTDFDNQNSLVALDEQFFMELNILKDRKFLPYK